MRINLYPSTPLHGSQRRRNLRHHSRQHRYRRYGRFMLLLCLCSLFWTTGTAQAAPDSQLAPLPRADRATLGNDNTVLMDVLANDIIGGSQQLEILSVAELDELGEELNGSGVADVEIVDNKVRYTFLGQRTDRDQFGMFSYTVNAVGAPSFRARTGFATIDIPPAAPTITLSSTTVKERDFASFGGPIGELGLENAPPPFCCGLPRFSVSRDAEDSQVNTSEILDLFNVFRGELNARRSLDFETRSSYTVRIKVVYGIFDTLKQDFVITVEDTNDRPTDINLSSSSVDENQPSGTVVGRFSTVDADSDNHTYTIDDIFDADHFQIDGDALEIVEPFDFEERTSYSIRVTTTDEAGGQTFKTFRIRVNNQPVPPDVLPNRLAYCTGDDITLLERTRTPRTLVKIEDITISEKVTDSCRVQGKMRITANGNTIRNLSFNGVVNERGQFTPAQTSIPDFDFNVAGMILEARDVEIKYDDDEPSLHITNPLLALPRELGVDPALVTVPTEITKIGLNIGTGTITLPSIVTKSGIGLELRGAFRTAGDGFEIDAGGTLAIPNIKKGTKKLAKGKTQDCAIGADVTIAADAQNNMIMTIAAGVDREGTGATVQTISTGPDAFASPDGTDGISLRKIGASLECSPGMPIANTGLFLTGLAGSVTLTPGDEDVKVEVTIEAGKTVGPFPVASLEGSMEVSAKRRDQERKFKLDMEAALKILFIQVAETKTSIRKNGFKASIEFNSVAFLIVPIPYTVEGEVAVFRKGRRATFTGSAEIAAEIKKGQIVEGGGCFERLIGDGQRCLLPPPLPPFSFKAASARVQAGEFTNGNFGLKGFLSIRFVASGGFFVDSNGFFTFRNVNRFKLIDDPFVRAALAHRQHAIQNGLDVQAAAVDGITFVDAGADRPASVIIDTPLIRPKEDFSQVSAAGVTDIITSVNLIRHGDVAFTLSSLEPMSLTLFTPAGQEVTPANFNQSETLGHVIEYDQTTTYVEVEPAQEAPEETGDEGTTGEFIEPVEVESNLPTLLFTSATSDPSLNNVDLKINGGLVYFDIDPQDAVWLKPIPLRPGTHKVELVAHNTDTVIQSSSINVMTGTDYSLLNIGGPSPELVLITDDRTEPSEIGKSKVRFFNGAEETVEIFVNGSSLIESVAYKTASDYVLVDPGEMTVEFRKTSDGLLAAPSLTATVGGGDLYTFFSTAEAADSESGFDAQILQRVDVEYAPVYIAYYRIDQAQMNDLWQAQIIGDTENVSYTLTVDGIPGPPVLGSVSVDDSNLAETAVSWQLTADIQPTVVEVYANPDEITTSITVTNTDGTTSTEEIPLYVGELVGTYEITDMGELGGQLVTKQVDLSQLETGIYHLWVRADDGINPPVSTYAAAPGVLAAGVHSAYGINAVRVAQNSYDYSVETANALPIIVDNSVSFPTEWTATITPTFNSGVNTLDVEWMSSSHPDIDIYVLHYGNTPLSSTTAITVGVATAEIDEDGLEISEVFGSVTVSNIKPDTPYYLSVEGVSSITGQSVRSQEVEFMAESPAFALGTPVTDISVAAGSSVSVPITLDAQDGLFFKNVWLSSDLSGAPIGISGGFETNTEQIFELNTEKTERPFEIVVDASVPAGSYPITVTGYNGPKQEEVQFNIVVSSADENPGVTTGGNVFLPFVSP